MSLRGEMALYTELSGNDGNHTPIGIIGAYLDGYEKGKEEAQHKIIRCKECRRHHNRDGSTAWLPCVEILTPDDFYCARAERLTDG